MTSRLLSPRARHIESSFDSDKTNSLQAFAQQEMSGVIEAKGYTPSHYSLFAVRKNDLAGLEVFGPKNLSIGNYSEEALYGAVSSPLPHFRSAIRTLAAKAAQIAALEEDDVEYSYQLTLFWSDVGKLKDFLGVSAHVSELVSEFLTAKFQFIGKDTPLSAIAAVARALSIATEAKRLDSFVIERVVDALESGGLDSLAVDALRSAHA